MDTVLITGVNGFVGQYLAERILKKGFWVVGIGKGENRLEFSHPNLTYVSCDFTDGESVINICKHYEPAFIIHNGALSKPDECELDREKAYQTNVLGTQNLLKAASLTKAFFLFLSTDFVFSGNEGYYTEDDKRSPVNYYGETKLLAEEEVKQYAYDWSIVRTILVYGKPKGGKSNILTMVANSLKHSKPLRMFEDQQRTPTYVEDLADALTVLVEKRATGIFHISGEDSITIYGLALLVADHLGLDKTLITPVTEKTFEQPASRPLRTSFDLTKAKALLDYQPTSLEEGIRRTFD